MLGLLIKNKERKSCFIDAVAPVINKGEETGLLFRLQSENATYFSSGYFYLDNPKEHQSEINKFMMPGEWINVPKLRKKRYLSELRYHVLSCGLNEIEPIAETKLAKDEEIGKIEDSFDKLPENPTFEFDGKGNLKVAVLRVGQGDLILVRFPSGEGIIIDANYSAIHKRRVNKYIAEFFNDCSLKALIISHKHLDHIKYAEEIARDFKIPECWWPVCSAHRHAGPTVKRIIINMPRNGTKILTMNKDLRYKISKDFKVSFRYPAVRFQKHGVDPNHHSIVVDIELAKHRIILGGDLSSWGWKNEYGDSFPETIDFLKVPHHGSKEGLGFEVISKTKILNSVTSCAQRNRYSHPHCEPLRSYFDSGEHKITCLIDENAVEYEVDRNGHYSINPSQQIIKFLNCQTLDCFMYNNINCNGCEQ
ncbi:MAG: MBL fold metallo-hydrolase [Candidatus Omnitrophica bacterium]|nr:MBL fold metallo-hydrolase [Candidatus Omnitrophota bacterium]